MHAQVEELKGEAEARRHREDVDVVDVITHARQVSFKHGT